MLRKIYRHIVAPHVSLGAAAGAARKRGEKAFQVVGSNMEPTLKAKQYAWYVPVDRLSSLSSGTVVVVAHSAYGESFVPSRVITLPGQTVQLVDGNLLVDGIRVFQPYLQAERAQQKYSQTSECASVPVDHVWLLGDFRDMSKDSRHLGPFSAEAILGRVTHVHDAGEHGQPRVVR